MWALFQQGELRPESVLTGVFALEQSVVDPNDVMLVIEDAREEEIQRQLRLAR
jgi:RIO kinase 1